MRVLLTSPMGNPLDARTWSAAPSNLGKALIAKGVDVIPFDSGIVGKPRKAIAAAFNLMRGLPAGDAARFDFLRAIRGRAVTMAAEKVSAEHILCTSSIDVPLASKIPYSMWIDDTVHLLQKTSMARHLGARAIAKIEELDAAAYASAANIFPFSQHVANDIVSHYCVPAARVLAAGCGSGPIPPLIGEKIYADGGLLFVAKHQFSEKGGDLLLAAWPEIIARRPQTKLILIGNGKAIKRARNLDGVTAFDFLPWDELVGKYHHASFLVQPMLGDPWGQVYLEAMKTKVIIVSLRQRALPELSNNGRNAFLIANAAPSELAEAVLAAYDTAQKKLAGMAGAAQHFVLEQHSWEAVADRIISRIG